MTFSWFRRHRVASIAGALTAVVIVAVAVVVVVAARDVSAGPIAGSGTLRAPTGTAFANTPVVSSATNVRCQVEPAAGTLLVTVEGGQPGGTCDIKAWLQRAGTAPGGTLRLDRVEFADATDETIVTGCGAVIPPAGPLAFSFRLELTAWPGSFVARPDAGVYVTAGTPSCP